MNFWESSQESCLGVSYFVSCGPISVTENVLASERLSAARRLTGLQTESRYKGNPVSESVGRGSGLEEGVKYNSRMSTTGGVRKVKKVTKMTRSSEASGRDGDMTNNVINGEGSGKNFVNGR